MYVYTRDNKGWKQQAYLKASNTAEGAQFGNSLTLSADGNLLAVGSSGEASSATGINGNQSDRSMPGAGAVYVFARAGAAWSQQAYLKSSNTGGPDVGYQFGYAVSLSSDGSTLAVSETSDPSNATGINGDQKNTGAPDSGAVFIFNHSGDTWSQQAYIKPWNTTTPGLLFGYSVGLNGNGDTLGVGAYNDDGRRGAVYVFTRNKRDLVAANACHGHERRAQAITSDARWPSATTATPLSPAPSEDKFRQHPCRPEGPFGLRRRGLRFRACGRQVVATGLCEGLQSAGERPIRMGFGHEPRRQHHCHRLAP